MTLIALSTLKCYWNHWNRGLSVVRSCLFRLQQAYGPGATTPPASPGGRETAKSVEPAGDGDLCGEMTTTAAVHRADALSGREGHCALPGPGRTGARTVVPSVPQAVRGTAADYEKLG